MGQWEGKEGERLFRRQTETATMGGRKGEGSEKNVQERERGRKGGRERPGCIMGRRDASGVTKTVTKVCSSD